MAATINLLRPRLRTLLARQPSEPHLWRCRVQLYKVYGGERVPCKKLHRGGYRATPLRAATLCSGRGRSGPYGRVVWYRADAEPPYRECPECEALYRAQHGGVDVEARHTDAMLALDGAESVSAARKMGLSARNAVRLFQATLQRSPAADEEIMSHERADVE